MNSPLQTVFLFAHCVFLLVLEKMTVNRKNFETVCQDWPGFQQYEAPADSSDFGGCLHFLQVRPLGHNFSRLFSLTWQEQQLPARLLFKPQELFASFGNETLSPIHNCMIYSYFRNVTEHERCCHSVQSTVTFVTSCKETKTKEWNGLFHDLLARGERSLCLSLWVLKCHKYLQAREYILKDAWL